MGVQTYKRPPIIEAMIQVSFADRLHADELAKADAALSQYYAQHHGSKNINFAVTLEPSSNAEPRTQFQSEEGHRRNSADHTEVVVLWPRSFLMSQLAPYPGWAEFFGRFQRDWALWKKAVGYRKIIRIGVRYVNRIDIPVTGQIVDYENYLRIYPHVPDYFGPNQAYAIQIRFPIPDLGCGLLINSSSAPPPLLGHSSFILDQDIARDVDIPQKDEALYDLLNDIHTKKNEVFEACITDRARELFAHE